MPGDILKACLNLVLQRWLECKASRDQLLRSMATVSRRTSENTDSLRAVVQAQATLEAELARQAEAFAAQQGQLARLEAQQTLLTKMNSAHAYNLEQARMLIEQQTRCFERLSQEVLERQVMDPFLVQFVRVYEAIHARNGGPNGSNGLQSLLVLIRSFLENHNVELIHPDEGELFDPRRHQPIIQIPSREADMRGRIATTVNLGLARGGRVIQPARVAVFTFADSVSAIPVTQQTE